MSGAGDSEGAAPQPRLSPGTLVGPDAASSSSSSDAAAFPATPSAFYRSAFARDCEAIALQLRAGGQRRERAPEPPLLPPPAPPVSPSRCPSTIEAEALTPLGPSWSFLSEAFRTPAGPARTPNRTYDCEEGEAAAASFSSPASSRATFLCPEEDSHHHHHDGPSFAAAAAAAPRGSLPAQAPGDGEEAPSKARRRTFELPGDDPRAAAPLVTSTPLLAAGVPGEEPGGGGESEEPLRSQQEEEEEEEAAAAEGPEGGRRGRGGEAGPVRHPGPPPARPPARPASRSARGGAGKGLLARRSLALAQGAPRKAAPAVGAAPGLPVAGKGARRAGAGTPGGLLLLLPRGPALPGKRPGGDGPSQPRGQKQLPDEIKKCPSKLPWYKSTSVSAQVPPKLARGAVAGVSLTYVGLEHNTTCAENEAPGTRLPVRIAGDSKMSKTGAQKRPLEKPADSASVQKPLLPKQACQGRGLMEKRAGGALLAAGQIPRADPGNGPVPLCLKCLRLSEENQRLTEEIQQLKALLDNCICKELQLPTGGSCRHSAATSQVWSEEDAK